MTILFCFSFLFVFFGFEAACLGLRGTNSLHCLLHASPAFLSDWKSAEIGIWTFSSVLCVSICFSSLHSSAQQQQIKKKVVVIKSQSTTIYPYSKHLPLSMVEKISLCVIICISMLVLPFWKAMSYGKFTGRKGLQLHGVSGSWAQHNSYLQVKSTNI